MGYKLVYFNLRGRGEAIRYLLTDNGIDYTDELIQFNDWPTYKPKMPFGQCPAFYDGDFQLVQSNSILRYLGRKHGLYPTEPKEAYNADMLNDGVEDLRGSYARMIYQNYDNGKADFVAGLSKNLQPFENILSANGAQSSGFAVGGKASFVDYNLIDLLDNLVVLAPECLNNFNVLKSYYNNFLNRPNMKAFRETEAFKARPINGNGKQ